MEPKLLDQAGWDSDMALPHEQVVGDMRAYRRALMEICQMAGNLSDDAHSGKTGANDARQRGLILVEMRRKARWALRLPSISHSESHVWVG